MARQTQSAGFSGIPSQEARHGTPPRHYAEPSGNCERHGSGMSRASTCSCNGSAVSAFASMKDGETMPLALAHSTAPRLWVPLLLVLGCASREVPARYPETSAASPEASVGASLQVTRTLASDPPLPGTEAPGWQGLSDIAQPTGTSPEAVDPHVQHRGHNAK